MKAKTKIPPAKNQNPVAGCTFVASKAEPETMIQNDNSDELATWKPARDLLTITNSFIEKQTRKVKRDGDNSYISDFSLIARMICQNMTTWNFNDLLSMSRSMDTPAAALVSLHNGWLEELRANGRLQTLNGCYSFPQYSFK